MEGRAKVTKEVLCEEARFILANVMAEARYGRQNRYDDIRRVCEGAVSIPYHGSALNITVHSYAGLLEFGLTACRRILSQDESYELIEHLRAALREIEALPTVAETPVAELVVPVKNEPSEASKKKRSAAVGPSEAAPQKPSAAN